MTERAEPAWIRAPEWLAAEMPPGYRTRLFEIERLSADLHGMEAIGRVLWETGEVLRNAVGQIFLALKCEVEAAPGTSPIVVKLGDSRRLLVVVARGGSPLQKTDEELGRAFQAVQFAEPGDRVVLVTNTEPATPPAQRPDPILPDALDVLQRMGVDVVSTSTLFGLWRLSHEDQPKARKALEHLYAQEGGLFVVPAR